MLIHTHIHTFAYTYTHTYICLYMHTYIHNIQGSMEVALDSCRQQAARYVCIHTYYTCLHKYTYIHTHTYIHTYAYTCIHTYIYIYIHTYRDRWKLHLIRVGNKQLEMFVYIHIYMPT